MFLATHTGILTSARSTSPHGPASQPGRTLPYRSRSALGTGDQEGGSKAQPLSLGRYVPMPPTSRSFGARLEPRYIVGAESLDQ